MQEDGYPLVFRVSDTKMLKMNPAALKLVREHREHFNGNRQRLIDRDCALLDAVSQGRPFYQLQHQRPRALGFFDTVDGGYVGMIERGEDLRFPLEAGQPVGISGEGVGQDLQRDLSIELRVGGMPDLSHAPLAEERGDVVVPEAGAGGQGHGLVTPEWPDLLVRETTHSTPRRPTTPRSQLGEQRQATFQPAI